MKKGIRARSSSVLRVVVTTTVGRKKIDALMFVHMALCLLFKKKCTMVKTKPDRLDLARVMIPTCFSIHKRTPAKIVLLAVDLETAMIKQTDALKLAHMD